MNIQTAIQTIVNKQDLTEVQMRAVMQQMMTGKATDAQIGGFLIGMRMKGESVAEITAAATVMRELAKPVHITKPFLVDIVGTGGDQAHTFNISTTSAFVLAAAGGCVAKHGSRSVSSKSGSADVLEAAGVNLTITPKQVEQCINKLGVGFMFAPKHHTAMKYALGPRKEMAVRTLFNLLGPLTNPANAPNQVIGVYADKWLEPFAEVLNNLGSEHVMIVHSEDGLDEISIGATTRIVELKRGHITTYQIHPKQFGITPQPIAKLVVTSVEESLHRLQGVLANQHGPARDIVMMNAGAAIYVAGLVENIADGMQLAAEVIENGKAKQKLIELINMTNGFKSHHSEPSEGSAG